MIRVEKIVIQMLLFLKVDSFFKRIKLILFKVKLARLSKLSGNKINFIAQGDLKLDILGDLSKFKIHPTSHLKSGALIECSGGVEIGEYFHVGKGLTIFSTAHNWENGKKIPYDEVIISKKVKIGHCVWVGSNVIILPGITIGNGAVIAAGSVVTKDVKELQIVGGNPAILLKERNRSQFEKNMNEKNFF